jgi:tetratricopeptide (TPR) repeat protein
MGDWLTDTMPPRQEVEAALTRVTQWPGLARSPQLVKFLNYIVEARLSGNEGGIKAYSIAVDVFGRQQSFDPQSDPIVRVQARRLRSALEEYYAEAGAGESLRFYLPVGRYIPEFRTAADDGKVAAPESRPPPAASKPPVRPIMARIDDIILVVLLTGVALALALIGTQVLAPRHSRLEVPQPPHVSVTEFTSVAAGGAPSVSVAGLSVELVTDLDLFPFVEAAYLQRADEARDRPAPYELTGIARTEGSEVQVTASLKRAGSDTAIWSMTQRVPIEQLPDSLDQLSGAFADQLGAIDGPLHADAVAWLASTTDIAGAETDYVCGLLFTLYRAQGSAELGQRARSCVSGLIRLQPASAAALSMRGTLLLDATLRTQPPGRPDPEPIAEAGRQIEQALKLAPTSSPVWREYAFYLEHTGRFGEAEAAFTSALQLNPSDLDAVAGYGRLLVLRGPSDKGKTLAEQALRRAVMAPYWYHEAPAVDALRAAEYNRALSEAEALVSGDAELASMIGTVAARKLGYQDVLNRYIAQLLEVTRFRRFGILPVLRQRLGDDALRDEIAVELAAAGIDQAALNGPY